MVIVFDVDGVYCWIEEELMSVYLFGVLFFKLGKVCGVDGLLGLLVVIVINWFCCCFV